LKLSVLAVADVEFVRGRRQLRLVHRAINDKFWKQLAHDVTSISVHGGDYSHRPFGSLRLTDDNIPKLIF
jgi:hypothetical protein